MADKPGGASSILTMEKAEKRQYLFRPQRSEISGLTSDVRPLTSDTAALLLYPHIWRTMRDFEPGTMLMVVANIKYDEAGYIRDRNEFEKIAVSWNDLGGSSGGAGK